MRIHVFTAVAISAALLACFDNDDSDDQPTAQLADYGDAPDNRVQPDGTFDDNGYPTLLGANGARVLDTTAVALADVPVNVDISVELDADDNADPDGEPNFRRFRQPEPDTENRDDHDNAIIGAELDLSDPDDPLLGLRIGVHLKDNARAGTYYVNVLFDHNLDGAWNATQGFATTDPPQQSGRDFNDEWVLKNNKVELSESAPVREVSFDLPLAGALFAHRIDGGRPYMRIALTDEPINEGRWRGEGEFAVGEIEDWVFAGLDNRPRVFCGPEPVPGFDFDGQSQISLPCNVARPPFADASSAIMFNYSFEQLSDDGPDVSVQCPQNPHPAAANEATAEMPLAMNCTANRLRPINDVIKQVAIRVITDLQAEAAVTRGFDSSVMVALWATTEYVSFTDTAPPSQDLTACIGLTGSHNNVYGGQIIQLSLDKLDCSMIPNDGATNGTFIVSGGEGFRGRGEMFLSVLGGGGSFLGSGNVVSLTYDGVPADVTNGWTVPVDQSSTGTLAVTFDSGLSFEIRIDITHNAEGLNTVQQTIVSGVCVPQ